MLVASALTARGVGVLDVLVFSGYVALGLVLPGTLLWRLVAGDRARPFVSDVVFGTCLAYAVELFWYLGVRAAGVPLLVVVWPVLVVGASLLPRWRARLWRPRDVHRMPGAWSWGMTAIVLVTVVFLARTAWRFLVIVPPGLLSPNQDLVYHLSLVGELRHHFPVASPVVDGEPLYYHWFLHAEIAASSWVTGIEPAVLLLRLSLVPMIVLTLLGAALLAGRLTGSARWGLLAPVLLVVGGVASMAPTSLSTDHDLWLSSRMYISPTIAFAHLLLVPVLALGMRLLSTDVPAPRRLWVAMALALGALSASKATVLPCVMAGFLGVVVTGALRGRLERRALALFAVSAVVFLVARRLIYGSQARGVGWDPLVTYETDAAKLGLAERAESAGLALAVLMLVVFLVQQLSFAAGIVGLVRGQWRDSHAQFLVGAAVAGTVASFTFAANASAQLHFVRTTPVVFAVASVWGLTVLMPRDRPLRLPHLLVATAVVAGALASAVQALNEQGVIGLRAHASVWGLVQPYVLAATGVLVLVAACAWASRRWPHWRGTTGVAAVVACLGLGLPSLTGLAVDVARDPVPPTAPAAREPQMIGTGGIDAARWLRAHSDPEDLLATNRHCQETAGVGTCDNRMFWLSAYSERRVLIEGWSYQVRTATRAAASGERACCLPFWDPRRLRTNNVAFRGVPRAVDTLRDTYGVRWLVLDRRSPYRLDRLRELADVRYRRGDYVVLELAPG
ncbi:MAG: hypothetical protein M3419_12505 [Actinomycetota bacterium]|nr:hypothetical protein [Actinomycetota bacterium]